MKAYRRGQYAEVEKEFAAAIREAEKFGEQDPRLATSLNALGIPYRAQAKYAKAEPFFRRALVIREKALGPEHPEVATSLNNVGGAILRPGQVRRWRRASTDSLPRLSSDPARMLN